jgi:hypothetical protein
MYFTSTDGNFNMTEDFTFEFWVRPPGLNPRGEREVWVTLADGVNYARSVNIGRDYIDNWLYISFNGVFATYTRTLAMVTGGSFVHIAVSRIGNNFKLFLNGTNVHEITNIAAGLSTYGSNATIIINSERTSVNSLSTNRFVGNFEDFRFTKQLGRYSANFTPSALEVPIWKDTYPKPLTKPTFSLYQKTNTPNGITVTAGTWDISSLITYQWQTFSANTWVNMAGETSLNLTNTYGTGSFRLKETATSSGLISKQYSLTLTVYST